MAKEIIHVGLYGGKSIFGGREQPLEASVIYCDKHDSCSFFKNGKCLAVRSFGGGCQFGEVQTVKGYTSRAKKYSEFKQKWKGHENYGKLSASPDKLGLIDGVVVFPYPFVRITKTESGQWKVEGPSFYNKKAYIPYDEFNSELIYRICSFRPQAIMGGTINTYQKETVPLFLAHLKEVLPEKYEDFTELYPEFWIKDMNYVGRKALLTTIKPSYIHYKARTDSTLNEEWYWDGKYLTYKSGYVNMFRIIDEYEIQNIVIKPTEKAVVVISSNEQVKEDTVFVD